MLFSVAASALTEIELVAAAGPFHDELVRETISPSLRAIPKSAR
jgi:hypothetical protein